MPPPGRSVVLTGAALLACALFGTGCGTRASSGARTSAPFELGVQDDGVLLRGGDALRSLAWKRIGELRADYVRVLVPWNDVVTSPSAQRRPARISYRLTPFDRLVREARSHGVAVQMTLALSAPAWATSNHRVGKTNPDPGLFAAFAGDMARHFSGKVGRFSVLNEPNLALWLKPVKTSAAQYRTLYPLAYSAIKRASPGAEVFFGETAPFSRTAAAGTQPLTWIAEVLQGARLKADGVAHHPYSFKVSPLRPWPVRGSVTIGSLGRLVSAVKGYARSGQLRTPGGGVPGIYLTEHGYLVNGPSAPAYRATQSLPATTRARYWTRSLTIARRTPGVRELLSYQLFPAEPGATWDTSILDTNGEPTPPFGAIADRR
jgi:hypothetical protein